MATKAIEGGTAKRRIRKVFGDIHEVVQMPNLIEVQRESYEQFLRSDPSIGYVSGLEKTLRSVFPIRDFAGTAELDFVTYELEQPKFDVEECRQRGITYAAPMRVTLRLIVFEVDPDTEARSVLDIKEQDVYMGDMPLMTGNGTFFINGTERVIVSQMHRSPGVLFDHDRGKTHASGKYLFAARVIPYRGSWLDFEFDAKDIVNVRIDRKRKLPVTSLLYALGLNSEEILNHFYNTVTFVRGPGGWQIPFQPENWRGAKPAFDIIDAKTGEVVFPAGQKISPRAANKAQKDGLETLLIPTEEIFNRYSAFDLINESTGEIYIEAGDEVSAENLEKLDKAGIERIELLDIDHVSTGPWIRNTLKADKAEEREQALSDIYRVMRPGEPPTLETAESLFGGLFFDPERYDLSAVGRVKLNMRLDLDAEDTVTTLRTEDILAVVKTLVDLKDGKGEVDDIDNLGNRRVRSVGELLENQYRVGLLRMERAVKERMSSVDVSTVMPNDLINAKPAVAAVREFFGSSQLSQFMDQTNPLAEAHPRAPRSRPSARAASPVKRAGFEVRDVHISTHYGRICPIETPEGPEHRPDQLAGELLARRRSTASSIDPVPQGHRPQADQDEVLWISRAMEEASARHRPGFGRPRWTTTASFNRRNWSRHASRQATSLMALPDHEVTLHRRLAPSSSSRSPPALIPFLEHDDANRALMGSNMQRQAVPLLIAEAADRRHRHGSAPSRENSGAAIAARRAGIVDQGSTRRASSSVATRPRSSADELGVDIYTLMQVRRAFEPVGPASTRSPLVQVGQTSSRRGQTSSPTAPVDRVPRASSPWAATRSSRFMPWNGYNYEDAILISERLVKHDVYTSIHIDEFDVDGPRHQARAGGHHPRHPQRGSEEGPAQPRRERASC
jgi:DNA-directed RNA polymerase subunit beta